MKSLNKSYDLSNHLGNVMVTVSDKRLGQDSDGNGMADFYLADVVSATDYYPFGSTMPGRTYSPKEYRYGFNGKEKDTEGMGGGGATYDYGFRIYNPQIAKFLSVDPLSPKFPFYTPYQFAGNMPIWAIDLDGLEEKIFHESFDEELASTMIEIVDETDMGKEFNKVLLSQNKFDAYYVHFESKAFVVDSEGEYPSGLGHDKEGYVSGQGGASGYTFVFKSMEDAKEQISKHYALQNVNLKDLEKSFEDGKEVVVFTIADKYKDLESISDENSTSLEKIKNSTSSGAETTIHEQTAHGLNRINGVDKTTEQEHKEYNNQSSVASPSREDLNTNSNLKKSKAKKAQNQVKKVIESK